jgi:small-conductance mechanosensitive channel
MTHSRGMVVPDISSFHSWIVVVHVLGVLLFVLAHGVSAAVMLRVRDERDPATLRAMLDLSRRSMGAMLIGLALWFLAGILAGFSGNWWTSGRYWIWASLGIAVVIIGVMTPFGRLYFNRIRSAVGVDPDTGTYDPNFRVDPGAVEAAVASGQPGLVVAIGVIGLALLAWLMIAKPF